MSGYYDTQDHVIILANGTVWFGTSHVTQLTHTTGTGSYALVFDRSLLGCNVITENNGEPDVQAVGDWTGNSLTVNTSVLSAGVFTPTDESFQVVVVC